MLGESSVSDVVDLRCLACGGALTFLPDSYPLVFHCQEGHHFILEDLLNHDLPKVEDGEKAPPLATLEFWKDRARLFSELAGCALQSGHAFAAADLKEAGNRIEGWATKLASVISKADTEALSD